MNLVRIGIVITFCMCSLFAVGCAGGRPTGYFQEENSITTRGGLGENGVFHDALYGPESIALNFPGYLIGFDKGRHHAVGKDAKFPVDNKNDQSGLRKVKFRMIHDPKTHYISHVMKYEGNFYGVGNCVIYTMYSQWGGDIGNNAGEAPAKHCLNQDAATGNSVTAQRDSELALKALSAELNRAIKLRAENGKPYTHIIVVSMGWNTPQVEAVQNFNAIASHIYAAAVADQSRYEPLFIGVTWPSIWTSEWLDPLIRAASYTAKAHDADEVGAIWLADVLDVVRTVAPSDVTLVALGHSFGARAMFSAVCGDSVWDGPRPPRKWDVLIGWEGAFSIRRLTTDGAGDGFAYKEGCLDRAHTVLLTSSIHDSAVTTAFWSDMAGSHKQWNAVCKDQGDASISLAGPPTTGNPTNCIEADKITYSSVGRIPIEKGKINYLDASNIVFFSHPNTGGGAHSDIYRRIHGSINWRAMR
ncbi:MULTISPECIES: hypothetical protein [Comamonas]|uniref:hypothetical protein n=1 Tax=Comamonas TaxID=283 RepID=UPI0002DBADDC|nr:MULTISPECIES: hypothetical protein [Comamonas]TFF62653.1 hypothetical protein EIC84_00830 [Comamonas sp. A23]